ncbi:hypothetical protein [Pacificoceanicola onchidii]|uniref:hypothetical protein n=1 Tax=Pacificoceanicola onchidii TaxID=2562685 RepID=UPI0010A53F8B|nr:hypothetical protein [Pacificoceanicola onchidii]
MSYKFERAGRNLTAILTLGVIWGGLVLGLLWLSASLWIVGGLFAVTLPMLWDVIRNRAAGLEMDETQIRWWSGRHTGDARLSAIDHVRFDTRLDLSVRVRLVLKGPAARRVQIPQDALPPHQDLQAELEARGVPVKRHYFSLM